jgi:hypothetical protein
MDTEPASSSMSDRSATVATIKSRPRLDEGERLNSPLSGGSASTGARWIGSRQWLRVGSSELLGGPDSGKARKQEPGSRVWPRGTRSHTEDSARAGAGVQVLICEHRFVWRGTV